MVTSTIAAFPPEGESFNPWQVNPWNIDCIVPDDDDSVMVFESDVVVLLVCDNDRLLIP